VVDRVFLNSNRPVVRQDGTQETEFQRWTQKVSQRALIIGSGNPEGQIEAQQGGMYMDEDGAAGNVLYLKQKEFIESP
jgi:hypothetical protein